MNGRSRLPVVTLILIGANLLAAFGLLFDPNLAYEFGFRPDHPSLRGVLTSLFLHANVFHLLGNMVFLAAVGAAVELASGSFRFAVVYFFAGVAGVAAHYLVTRRMPDPVPLIGASGCVAGCAAYYSFRYTSLRVPLAPKLALSVAAVTAIWLLLQVVGAFIRLGDSSGVSFWAHIGGFASGILLSLVFRAPDLGQVKLGHEVLDRMNARGPAAVVLAANQHLERHPRDVKALWELADAQGMLADRDAEADALLRLLDVLPDDAQPEALRRLAQAGRITRLTPLRRLQLADQHPAVARALLKSVVEGPKDEAQRADAILALAALERETHPARCGVLLAELQKDYPLHPAVELARKRGWLT
ncbi:MAG: rhomboid family intramembrane serine protease [Fimbriimonas sp.]